MAVTQTISPSVKLSDVYGSKQLAAFAFAAIAAAVLIAGFWNYHLVDGFGRDVIAVPTIGDTSGLVGSFHERGTNLYTRSTRRSSQNMLVTIACVA